MISVPGLVLVHDGRPSSGVRPCAIGRESEPWRQCIARVPGSLPAPEYDQPRSETGGVGVAIGTVGVVGLGTMGAGIAQVCLEAGHAVVACDVEQRFVDAGTGRIEAGLAKRVEKGLMESGTAEAARGRLTATTDLGALSGGRARDRGDRRGARAEARAVRATRRHLRRRHDPRHQHVGAVGVGGRRRLRPSDARGRPALLQPGAADEADRGGADGRRRRRGVRRRAGVRVRARQGGRAVQPTRPASSSTGS